MYARMKERVYRSQSGNMPSGLWIICSRRSEGREEWELFANSLSYQDGKNLTNNPPQTIPVNG